jgi:hypothetical protein
VPAAVVKTTTENAGFIGAARWTPARRPLRRPARWVALGANLSAVAAPATAVMRRGRYWFAGRVCHSGISE